MSNEMIKQEDSMNFLSEIDDVQSMVKRLMSTKHYQKIGEDGIFAIIVTAKSINMPILDALNGQLYIVQGKVGMSYEAMNMYIRMAGHSIQIKHLDSKSCTLIGKRKDTGDVAEITYDMEDARKAGKSYDKHPKTMLFARCLSMLKRFLFPDVCTKVYVKEEIHDIPEEDYEVINVNNEESIVKPSIQEPEPIKMISSEQFEELDELFQELDDETKALFLEFLRGPAMSVNSLIELPSDKYEKVKKILIKKKKEKKESEASANTN